ncbi:MAG: PAS domain S-box protein [Candidatus Hydrogenedens sp.]|nr:PAS domain S-box protein [Candidatus Hydrogenedentota bacterium]NLF57805.1 PAS domain S-box protein [Candidatus Hydrogenedens sp.]
MFLLTFAIVIASIFWYRLRQAKEEQLLAFDAVREIAAILDRDGRILRMNRTFSAHLGRHAVGESFRACLLGSEGGDDCPVLPKMDGDDPGRPVVFYSPVLRAHLQVTCGVPPSGSGADGGLLAVIHDISEQVRTGKTLAKNQMRSEVLSRLGGMFDADLESLYIFALREGVRITESKMGVLFFYDEDTQIFTPHVRYGGRLGDRAIVVDEAPYFLENTGSLGESVRQRGPLIINDYSAHSSRKTGLSGDATKISRYLNMPVFSGNRIVAVVGVADKEEDYDGDDLAQLRLLMEGAWRLIERAESNQRLKARQERVIAHQNALLLLNTSPRMDFHGWIRHCLATASHTLGVARAGYWRVNWETGHARCLVWYRREDNTWLHTGEHTLDEVRDYLDLTRGSMVLALRDTTPVDLLIMRENGTADPDPHSILYSAVRREGNMAGVLALDHCGGPRTWTSDEQEFAAALGEQIALALETEERKKAERELARREAEYRLLLENHSDLVVKAGMDCRLLYVNPAYCATFGKSEKELLGLSLLGLTHEADLPLAENSLKSLQHPPHETRHDARALTRNGWRWFSWQARGVFEKPDEVSSFICVGRDITDRKLAEMALRESQAKLRAILDSANQTFVLFDTEGVIQAFNQMAREKAETVFLRTLVVGEKILDSLPEAGRPGFSERFKRALGGETIWDEKQITGLNGVEHLVGYGMRPVLDEDERVAGVCLNLVDLTERRRMQEERRQIEAKMQQTQKLESLGMLAGGIAHDFNNLLLAIIGNIDLAMVELPENDGVQPLLDNAKTVSLRAADLCRQMLAYTGKGTMTAGVLSLEELIREMSDILRVSISKKVLLDFVAAPDIPFVEGDASQLRQVVMNLIINASEAIGDRKGAIHISLTARECGPGELAGRWLDDEPRPAGTYVCLEVGDNGCGMDRETLERIFDPFYSTKFTGRGLGLAAVLGIVRAHRGVVRVSSESGKGTTFSVLFPATTQRPGIPAVVEQPVSLAGWQTRGLALLADDEGSVRDFGSRLLQRMGFTVLTAKDGQEAVELFRRRHAEGFEGGEPFKLALLDVTMPHLDGMEVLNLLRAVQKDLPILLSSGYDEHEITRQIQGMPNTGFIQKPYPISALQGAVQALLEEEPPHSAPDSL